ncbi:MAG: hypothetical protein ABI634_08710 [Acidobacteriota bacterium]
MSDSATVFLGIMAVSLAVMALIQVGLIIAGIRVAQKLGAAIDDVRREIRPLMDKVNQIADDAGRATSMARQQVERIDEFMATATSRIDDTLGIVQSLMSGPVRQGAVAMSAVRAVMGAIRQWQSRKTARPTPQDHDEDDAWFVG